MSIRPLKEGNTIGSMCPKAKVSDKKPICPPPSGKSFKCNSFKITFLTKEGKEEVLVAAEDAGSAARKLVLQGKAKKMISPCIDVKEI